MNVVQVMTVLAAAAVMVTAEEFASSNGDVPAPYPIMVTGDASDLKGLELVRKSLEPTRPEEGPVEVPRELSKRSTTVFRPLFATRERDAERQEAQERRRQYWATEQRRRSPQPMPHLYPAGGNYPASYPGQYRPYPAGR